MTPRRSSAAKLRPKWRNQALAWFFNRLQLAQAEGQGIPTILRTMREEGCPPPAFRTSPQHVVCVLPAHPRHVLQNAIVEAQRAIARGDIQQAWDRVEFITENLDLPERRSAVDPAQLIDLANSLSRENSTAQPSRTLVGRLMALAGKAPLSQAERRQTAAHDGKDGSPES